MKNKPVSSECDCCIVKESIAAGLLIEYCPLHKSASDLYEALRITTEILSYWMPRIKEQIGEDILYQAELRKAHKALAKAEGK